MKSLKAAFAGRIRKIACTTPMVRLVIFSPRQLQMMVFDLYNNKVLKVFFRLYCNSMGIALGKAHFRCKRKINAMEIAYRAIVAHYVAFAINAAF